MGSRARAQEQDLATIVVKSAISSPNAPMRIEKLVVEGSFPRTRANIQRPQQEILQQQDQEGQEALKSCACD